MKRVVLFLAIVIPLPASARAQSGMQMPDHHGMEVETIAPNEPPIRITINPEARVSAVISAQPPAAHCGSATDLPVKIINQAYITARVEGELVGSIPEGATLNFQPERLTGAAVELRVLQITLPKPGPSDLTIAFRARGESPDLGGRDRIHLLLRCQN